MNDYPLIEGRGFTVTPATLTETIDRATASYRNRTGQAPTHIALPDWADPVTLNLSLALARSTGKAGPVVVGRAQINENGNGHAGPDTEAGTKPPPRDDGTVAEAAPAPGLTPLSHIDRWICRNPECDYIGLQPEATCPMCGWDGEE